MLQRILVHSRLFNDSNEKIGCVWDCLRSLESRFTNCQQTFFPIYSSYFSNYTLERWPRNASSLNKCRRPQYGGSFNGLVIMTSVNGQGRIIPLSSTGHISGCQLSKMTGREYFFLTHCRPKSQS